MRNEQSSNSYDRSASDLKIKEAILPDIAWEIEHRSLRHADIQSIDPRITKNNFTDLKDGYGGNISLDRIKLVARALGLETAIYDPSERVAA